MKIICQDCGKSFEAIRVQRGFQRRFCDDCSLKRRRDSARKGMKEVRQFRKSMAEFIIEKGLMIEFLDWEAEKKKGASVER